MTKVTLSYFIKFAKFKNYMRNLLIFMENWKHMFENGHPIDIFYTDRRSIRPCSPLPVIASDEEYRENRQLDNQLLHKMKSIGRTDNWITSYCIR